jgi:hypothetical protein
VLIQLYLKPNPQFMKTNDHPFLYVASPDSNNTPQKKDLSAVAEETKSPYLRAILSGKAGPSAVKKILSAVNSDRIAAIRYIKESAFLRKA